MSITDVSGQINKYLEDLGVNLTDDPTTTDPEEPPVLSDNGNLRQALINMPLPEMVKEVGISVATAQMEMNLLGARMARVMAGLPDNEGRAVTIDFAGEQGLTLFELGFTPQFYQFTETLIDIMALFSYSAVMKDKRNVFDLGARAGVGAPALRDREGYFGPNVEAHLSVGVMSAQTMTRYNIKAAGSGRVKTRVVPVPAPAVLQDRINSMQSPEIQE